MLELSPCISVITLVGVQLLPTQQFLLKQQLLNMSLNTDNLRHCDSTGSSQIQLSLSTHSPPNSLSCSLK